MDEDKLKHKEAILIHDYFTNGCNPYIYSKYLTLYYGQY